MEQIYINIKNRRKELGMSQADLAQKIGYTDRSSIAKIETGKIDITVGLLKRISLALEIDPIELLGWGPDDSNLL